MGNLARLGSIGLVALIGSEVVFPAVFAVIGVGEDFQNEDAAGVVMDRGNEAMAITGNVEDGDGLGTADDGEVRMRKDFANIGDGLPLGGAGHGEPCGEVGGGIRVLFGIVEDAALGYDSHPEICCQISNTDEGCQVVFGSG